MGAPSDAPDGNRREPKAYEVEYGAVRSEGSGPQSQARPPVRHPPRAAYEEKAQLLTDLCRLMLIMIPNAIPMVNNAVPP